MLSCWPLGPSLCAHAVIMSIIYLMLPFLSPSTPTYMDERFVLHCGRNAETGQLPGGELISTTCQWP